MKVGHCQLRNILKYLRRVCFTDTPFFYLE